MSAEVLTMPNTQPFVRMSIDREAFRRLCIDASVATGMLQACITTLGAHGAAVEMMKKCEGDLRAAIAAALVSARPA
jgi:hypothetical protein